MSLFGLQTGLMNLNYLFGPVPSLSEEPIPAVASGQTLRWRETWDSTPTNASPGVWTAVTDNSGRITGGINGGPTVYKIDGTTRNRYVSGHHIPSAADVTSGYTPKKLSVTTPNSLFTAAVPSMVHTWFRPSSATIYSLLSAGGHRAILEMTDAFNNPYFQFDVISGFSPGAGDHGGEYKVRFSKLWATTYDGPWIPIGEWCEVWVICHHNTNTMKGYVRYNGITTLVMDTTTGGAPANPRIVVNRGGVWANQQQYSGQVGPISLYELTNVAAGATGPTDYLPPNAVDEAWTVHSQTGNDANINGPLATFGGVVTAFHEQRIPCRSLAVGTSGSGYINYSAGGSYYSAGSSSARSTLRGQLESAFVAGTESTHRGPVITFTPGDQLTVPSGGADLRSVGTGIKWKFNGAVLRMDEPLDGAWTEVATNVWRYDGSNRAKRHVFGGTTVTTDANGRITGYHRVKYINCQASNYAAAEPLIQAKPYSYWVDGSGVTYVYAESDPASLNLRGSVEGALRIGSGSQFWTGSVVDGGYVVGGNTVNCLAGLNDRATANYNYGVDTGPYLTIFRNCIACEYGKHAWALVGGSIHGMMILVNPVGEFAPPDIVGGSNEYGVGISDWSTWVDYTSASTSVGSPGRIVTSYYKPSHPLQHSKPGYDSDYDSFSGSDRTYYTHGTGVSSKQFELTVTTFDEQYNPGGVDYFWPSNTEPSLPLGTHVDYTIVYV
jgi:hypothetical protein